MNNNLNHIKKGSNITFNIILIIISAMCIIPVIFITIISLSSDASIQQFGYRFIPKEWSLDAYKFLWNEKSTILHALLISITVTSIGVVLGTALTATMGYTLSRPNYKAKGFLTWLVFIPMIFNGGMVATYVIISSFLHLNNTIWALILPLAVSPFNIIICKTFFKTTIPESIIESGRIDGASQFTIFSKIVLPISTPVLATIGIFLAFAYWNDWFLSSLYITKSNLISLQAMLNNILKNIQYLASNPTAGVSLAQYKSMMPQESARMAIAIVIVIPIACVYPFFQRYFITGLTVGAIKG
ncbi:MAG: carbohydrate ABC transporter permease [Pleomorphochaeta sp.]